MPLISIITPVLNEEAAIGPFLDNLAHLQGDFELIVADGGSSDGTVAAIEQCRPEFRAPLTLLTAPTGRGIQMNAGAAVTRGDILLFLHVDCTIPDDALFVIKKACETDGVVGGAFRQSFPDPDLFFVLSSGIVNLLAKYTGIFFGDFGIFVKKEFFSQSGGYEPIPYMEDVEFCRSAQRHGRLVQVDRVILSSPRRFLKVGRVRLVVVYALACVLNGFGIRPVFLRRFILD